MKISGDLHLYPMIVKTQSGEKLELQVSTLNIETDHHGYDLPLENLLLRF